MIEGVRETKTNGDWKAVFIGTPNRCSNSESRKQQTDRMTDSQIFICAKMLLEGQKELTKARARLEKEVKKRDRDGPNQERQTKTDTHIHVDRETRSVRRVLFIRKKP